MRIKNFNRYELKYILPRDKADTMAAELGDYLDFDDHGGGGGQYNVTSVYYDTDNYKAYWDKIEGHPFRRKVRIRVYNYLPLETSETREAMTPESRCFVEIKQRQNKRLQKKRVFIPYRWAIALCNGQESDEHVIGLSASDKRVVQEIQYLAQTLHLRSACLVSYDRLAFNGGVYDPGLRVTFDTNLKCRAHALSLLKQDAAENHFFLPPDWCVMEVKFNNRVPYWLTEFLGLHRCTLRRISKYCTALEVCEAVPKQRQIFC